MNDRKDDMEEEANLFARSLLMPEFMLRAEVKKLVEAGTVGDLLDDHEGSIAKLAKKFEVSQVVMTLRLQELGLIKS